MRDETVEGFWAYNNKKLQHFPSNLAEKFPNLLALSAYSCAIREIRRECFKGLKKLRHLALYGNQIEKIDDGTFEYIPFVEKIALREYFIVNLL